MYNQNKPTTCEDPTNTDQMSLHFKTQGSVRTPIIHLETPGGNTQPHPLPSPLSEEVVPHMYYTQTAVRRGAGKFYAE